LKRVYAHVTKEVSVAHGFSQDKLFDSSLGMWPMYHFLQ
jgi:hypothetical protein